LPKSKLKTIVKLLGLVRPLAHIMLITIGMGSVGFLTAIFMNIFGGYGLLNLLGYKTLFSNSQIPWIIALIVIVLAVTRYLEQLSGHYIAFKLLAEMRDHVFTALRKLAPSKLEGKDKGNMIAILTSDIELIEVFYAHTIAPVAIAIVCSLVMIGFMGSFHYALGIVALISYTVVGIFIPVINTKTGSALGREYRQGFGDLNSYLLESLRGLKEVLQFEQGSKRREALRGYSKALSEKNKKLKNKEGMVAALTDTAILVSGFTMLVMSIGLMQKGQLDMQGVIIPTIAMLGSFGPTVALSNLSNGLLQTLASAERVIDVLEEKPLVEDIIGKEEVKPYEVNGLVCKDLTFAYADEKVLEQIGLEFKKNHITGIYGVSGSGKSTLLKLLMRFWKVDEGEIVFEGAASKSIEEINTTALRKMIGYVTQETYLFHDSIIDNIKVGKPEATDEEVVEAAKKASIHEFILSLPNGYDTKVGELGSTLSGGERQRIGIARAFLHDAPILLLDEPTSNLDSLNEAIILKALKNQHKEKCIVLVSHRKSTLGFADTLHEMKSGRVS
jgi:ATP-binding cassette subfamily C protein